MNRMVFSDGGETAVCYIEKKLSASESRSQTKGSSFCILLQCHKYCHSKKGPWGREVEVLA